MMCTLYNVCFESVVGAFSFTQPRLCICCAVWRLIPCVVVLSQEVWGFSPGTLALCLTSSRVSLGTAGRQGPLFPLTFLTNLFSVAQFVVYHFI